MSKEVIKDGDDGIVTPESAVQEVTTNNIGTDADHRIGAMTMADSSTSMINGDVYATNLTLSGSAHATFTGEVKISDGISITDGVLNFGDASVVDLSGGTLSALGTGTVNFYGTVDITGTDLVMGAGKFNFFGETIGGVVKLNNELPSVTYDESAFPKLYNDVVNDTIDEVFGEMTVTKADLDFHGKIGEDTDDSLSTLNIGDGECGAVIMAPVDASRDTGEDNTSANSTSGTLTSVVSEIGTSAVQQLLSITISGVSNASFSADIYAQTINVGSGTSALEYTGGDSDSAASLEHIDVSALGASEQVTE